METKQKKAKTHNQATVSGAKIALNEVSGNGDDVVITYPKGMPYAKLRKALEFASLRVK